MRVAVFGLWHLGCITAAALAESGHRVVGLDLDSTVVDKLNHGEPPIDEPGLAELIKACQIQDRLTFTTNAALAVADTEVVWITFDTPVDDNDDADVSSVDRMLDAVAPALRPGTLVLISSQVPVGFTANLERSWAGRGLRFAVSPENLRLGNALDCFRKPERIIVGCRDKNVRDVVRELLQPFCANFQWMSIESAEMTKHAVNAFLATSVSFINELARICEMVGADAKEVERGLKSESRIGPKAYLTPGAAFAGGTLARDIRFLMKISARLSVNAPLIHSVWHSNFVHTEWMRRKLADLLQGVNEPVVAMLGLTYKPRTNTLRRSSAIELCRWLHGRGVRVQGHDPAIAVLPGHLDNILELRRSAHDAMAGADVAVIGTEWPEFKSLTADLFAHAMRHSTVIDQNHFLADLLAADPRICYQAVGRPARTELGGVKEAAA